MMITPDYMMIGFINNFHSPEKNIIIIKKIYQIKSEVTQSEVIIDMIFTFVSSNHSSHHPTP